jgi:hypothetical protein
LAVLWPYPNKNTNNNNKQTNNKTTMSTAHKRTHDELMQSCQKESGKKLEKSCNEPTVVDAKVVFGTWKEDDIPADSIINIEGKKTTRCFATFKLEPKEGIPTIEGQADVEYLMSYSKYDPANGHEALADYTGILKVSGAFWNKKGAFLCQHVGNYGNMVAKSSLTILPNTGTEELAGISGYGEFNSAFGGDSYLRLSVTFGAADSGVSSFESDRKKIATNFLQLSAAGKCDEAYAFVDMMNFKHHNIHFPGDAKSLKEAQEENAKQMPNKVLEVKKIVQENDHVVTFSLVTMSKEMQVQVCHMFKFNETNRVIELWDMGQVLPEKMVNENGPF